MPRALPTLLPADLELRLLRKGVGALTAGRDRCSDCGRTPLVGERVHVYAGDRVVCDLCRPRRPAAPERSMRVHHFERGHTVRLRHLPAA
jgi:hypothetical protein